MISAVLQTNQRWKRWEWRFFRGGSPNGFSENDGGFHRHHNTTLKHFKHQMGECVLEKCCSSLRRSTECSAFLGIQSEIAQYALFIHFSPPWVSFWNCGTDKGLKGDQECRASFKLLQVWQEFLNGIGRSVPGGCWGFDEWERGCD